MTDAAWLTITALAPRIASGHLRSERLTEEALTTIGKLNPKLNAFITVTGDDALASARHADKEIAAGRYLGPLHGIPISLKDLIDVAGVPTTAASRLREGRLAATDAPIVRRLKKAGVVLVGKTNLHEFAFGTTNEDSGWGAARNPVDPQRSPGGSSGGSAIAVRTGMSVASIGTDTGGSIRIPAAACGIVGLKPTSGEISANGVVPLSRQLDHVGPLTRSVADAALLYDVLRDARPAADAHGKPINQLTFAVIESFLSERISEEVERGVRSAIDALRSAGATVRTAAIPHANDIAPINQLTFAVIESFLSERISEEVERGVRSAIEALRSAGATVRTAAIPHANDIAPIYLHLVLADAAAYHAAALAERPAAYTPNVRLRLEMGRYILAEDYVRALRGKEIIAREVEQAIDGVDALLLPALAIEAPPIGAASVPVKGGKEVVRNVMLRCTQPFNLSGHPALSLPCGVSGDGLPIGLQIVGHRQRTAELLAIGRTVEQALARR